MKSCEFSKRKSVLIVAVEAVDEGEPEADTSDRKQPETEKFRPAPPTENGDIIPLFPGKKSSEKKQLHKGAASKTSKTKISGDKKEDDEKKEEEVTDGEVNNESGEIEYYKHQLEFNEEDSEKDDSESDYDSDSKKSRSRSTSRCTSRTSVHSDRKLRRSYSSSSESSTITSGSERAYSKATSKTTEKTTVHSNSDHEKEEDDHENVDDKKKENGNDAVTDHLTSHVYVVPETKSHEKELETKVPEPVPHEENVFVIHLFEKDKQDEDESKEVSYTETPKNGNVPDEEVVNSSSNRHKVNLQLYPGVEYFKTVIRLDKETEDVSLLKDVFLKDAIITDGD